MLSKKLIKPLVSIVVPVYKVEDVLERCLDSLCRQSLTEIEILLIDDASPDRCGEICNAYAEKDNRFRVFHNEKNGGLSVARNIGIANASSDYLMFVDSDDYVCVDFCKAAYECAIRYKADLVMFRFLYVNKSKHCLQKHNEANSLLRGGLKTQIEATDLLRNNVGSFAWNKLYRIDLFNDISYPAGYLFEDLGTTYKIIWQASRIYYLDRVLYYYCYREDSITALKTEKSLNDRFVLFMQQYDDLKEWGYPSDKLDELLKNIAIDYCIKKKLDISDERYVFCSNVLLKSKSIPVDFTLARKVLFVMFKYCPFLFEKVCDLAGKRFSN